MATRHVLADLAAVAADEGLPQLQIEAVGGVDAARRVREQEPFDLVFLAAGALGKLAAEGHVDERTVAPLVVSSVAAAVASETTTAAERPDGIAFTDAAAMRDAIRTGGRIGYSTGPSGDALVQMIAEWGLSDELGDRLVQARPGVPVAASVAAGEVDLGFQQLSELVGQPGIRILGVLPPDRAIDTVFAGAVGAATSDGARAHELLNAFTSGAADQVKRRHNFAVPPTGPRRG
ncbi:MAG: molybdate ABC transporter substrate-binding protein [Microbacterium sp.]|uniref:molybdate ABC transporter substrate-binding protein n=1 Tax=Microbacterium sp. TaxID=51671 RepID=UPI003A844592